MQLKGGIGIEIQKKNIEASKNMVLKDENGKKIVVIADTIFKEKNISMIF